MGIRVFGPVALVLAVLGLSACSNGGDGQLGGTSDAITANFHTLETPALEPGEFELMTLSTMPDTVTGGDVLVGIRGLGANDSFTVSRNGRNVTEAFHRLENGEVHGLVTGLQEGSNTISVSANGRNASLGVKNHPITGPVISGPHQKPFICRTEDNGLGPALDENCSAETKYQWFARSALTQRFTELSDPYASYPPDTMSTTTTDGRIVPYVVRVESATINRGIARIAVLDDPAARGPDAPFVSNGNGRVFYAFGESCGVGYHQGSNDPDMVLGALPDPTTISADRLLINVAGVGDRLAHGDVTVHSTLSAFGVHCNPLISVETTMMIKEHISEQYRLVTAMIGTNGSGAALQQYNAANNAPGLLTAAMPTATFADIVTTAMTVTDCGLLQHYYENSSLDWRDQKKAAVNGHNLLTGTELNAICQSWTDAFLSRINASEGCDGAVPDEIRYNAETNPKGVRCTIQDANVNIFGRDSSGKARRPLDNIGIQYGLGALNGGVISFDEFIDLNRNIGGFDIDGNFVPERHSMSPEVEALTYRIGGILGRGAIAETPIMDLAPYLDLIPTANIHEAVRPFIVRARIRQHTGQDETQSIWRGVLTQPDAYPVMEQWFTSLQEMPPSGDRMQDVIAAKPAGAADRCAFGTIGGRLELPHQLLLPLGLQAPLVTTLPGLSQLITAVPGLEGLLGPISVNVPLRVDVPENFDSGLGPCSVLLPVTRTPRMVAGMPMSDDIIKCQLKPVDPSDYADGLDDARLRELQQVFPEGVCDYTRPAAGDVEKSMIWPSVGGKNLEKPHELKWRVARSG